MNFIQRASPNPAKALVKALNRLKKRDEIVITKPAKGSEVVVMDKPEYIRLLSAASVDNSSKFSNVNNLLSTTEAFDAECVKLLIFSRFDYPRGLIDSAINNFIFRNASAGTAERNTDDINTVRISLPFKDQVATNAVRKQLRDRSRKILLTLQPVFVTKKLGQDLKPKEIKPSIVNRQCVVYRFSCDPCDADYVGYTARNLHQRTAEHKYSAIGRHFVEVHGSNHLLKENQFRVLRKC